MLFFNIIVFIFGACWGSFLNVVIYRVPKELSLISPRSFCRTSGKTIPWYDNIPILSWFILHGRSRFDGQPISIRYPFIEGLTGLLFLLCWYCLPIDVAIVGWVFICILLSAIYIDLDHMILPDILTIGGMLCGLILSIVVPNLHGFGDQPILILAIIHSLAAAIIGVCVGSAVLLWISVLAENILKREAMGFGDVLFMGCIGSFCGWEGALFAIFGGALIGTIFMIPIMLIQRLSRKNNALHIGMGTSIPFGPWLAIGALGYFIFLREPVDAYFLNLQRVLLI